MIETFIFDIGLCLLNNYDPTFFRIKHELRIHFNKFWINRALKWIPISLTILELLGFKWPLQQWQISNISETILVRHSNNYFKYYQCGTANWSIFTSIAKIRINIIEWNINIAIDSITLSRILSTLSSILKENVLHKGTRSYFRILTVKPQSIKHKTTDILGHLADSISTILSTLNI